MFTELKDALIELTGKGHGCGRLSSGRVSPQDAIAFLDDYQLGLSGLLIELKSVLEEITTARDGYVYREEVEEYIDGFPRYEFNGYSVAQVAAEAMKMIDNFHLEFKQA
jgi:hypothetical protein